MKVAIIALFTSITTALAAPAAPQLAVDMVVTDYDTAKKPKVLARVNRLTKSGKSVTIHVRTEVPSGVVRYTVTPTLLRNGTVDYSETLIRHYDAFKKISKFTPPERSEPLGETVTSSVGSVIISTRTTIAK